MLPDEPASDDAEVNESPSVARDYESEAKAFGWKPKDEYAGKAPWTDAETYIGKVELSQRATRKMIDERDRKHADQLARIERNADIAVEGLKQQAAKEIAYWQQAARVAASKGDLAGFDQATAAVEQAKQQAPRDIAPARSEKDVADDKFAEDNPWYEKDKAMTAFARGQSVMLLEENPNMSIAENRKLVAEAVREQFPQKFGGEQKRFSAVDGGSAFPSAGRKGNSKGFDSLPREAKEAAEKYVAKGWFKTTEEYAKDYFAEIDKTRSRA